MHLIGPPTQDDFPMEAWLRQTPKLRTNPNDVEEDTPCRVCGGPVAKAGADAWGPWRQHRDCARIAPLAALRVQAAARVLGIGEVDVEVARLVDTGVSTYASVHPEPCWTDDDRERDRGAWLHVDKKALLRSISEATMEREELSIERPCGDGCSCAWCGRAEALEWWAHGHQWRDGSEAPLCGDCAAVYMRYWPSVQFWDDQRPALAEALSGVPVGLGEIAPAGLVAFAETDADGTGVPWSHLPAEAVEAYRMTQWGRWNGRHAPAEHKAEALARARDAEAERAASIAARETSDPYGFSEPGERNE